MPDYNLEYFPEPEEMEPVAYCAACECPLYKGDTVYLLRDRYFCEDCISDARRELGDE